MPSFGLCNISFLFVAAVAITQMAVIVTADFHNNTTTISVSRHLREAAVVDYHVTMLNAVNRERTARGLPRLCLSSKLKNAALGHSRDMAKKSFLSHAGSDGSSISKRVDDAGYDWTYVSENVAAGHTTVASVVASWMQSRRHRANILSPQARMFECGYAYGPSSTLKHYWTQNFASGSGERCN